MNASEARSTAVSIANREAAKKSAALKKRREALKKSVPLLRAERIKKIETEFREHIKWAVEDGKTTTTITLSSNGNDCLRGQYKYLPLRKEKYGDGRNWHHATGEGYLKYAPWGKYVKLILARLRRDGFECVITEDWTRHVSYGKYDDTTYTTKDTVLTISW